MRYLDPKSDLIFKKIFGTHPNLARSLLNSLLPLPSPIVSIEYLTPEQVPVIPALRNSIVDVRCVDETGRVFIVEMQMFWSKSFQQRIVFNAAKSYVSQLDARENFSDLKPVYALSLVNAIIEPTLDSYYHHYSLLHSYETQKKLEGLEFVFIELPKFKSTSWGEKKMQVLWLRFLTEMQNGVGEVPEEFLQNEEIKEAVAILEESSFSKSELEDYDRNLNFMRTMSTIKSDAERLGKAEGKAEGFEEGMEKGKAEGFEEGIEKGKAEGMEKGMEKGKAEGFEEGIEKGKAEGFEEGMEKGKAEGFEEGIEKGKAEGIEKKKLEIAKSLKKAGIAKEIIRQSTGLSEEELNAL